MIVIALRRLSCSSTVFHSVVLVSTIDDVSLCRVYYLATAEEQSPDL